MDVAKTCLFSAPRAVSQCTPAASVPRGHLFQTCTKTPGSPVVVLEKENKQWPERQLQALNSCIAWRSMGSTLLYTALWYSEHCQKWPWAQRWECHWAPPDVALKETVSKQETDGDRNWRPPSWGLCWGKWEWTWFLKTQRGPEHENRLLKRVRKVFDALWKVIIGKMRKLEGTGRSMSPGLSTQQMFTEKSWHHPPKLNSYVTAETPLAKKNWKLNWQDKQELHHTKPNADSGVFIGHLSSL